MFCAKCGNELAEGMEFCGKCGTKVNAVPVATTATSSPSDSVQGTAPQLGGAGNTTLPKLYNPNAAGNLSLLFTPVFGSWCIWCNCQTLGLADNAKRSLFWMIANIVVVLVVLFAPLPGRSAQVIYLLMLVVWNFAEARKQNKYLTDNKIAYEKCGWGKPILVTIGIMILFYGCLFWFYR